jgi:hypothetical protein
MDDKITADIDNYSAASYLYTRVNMKACMLLRMRASFFNLHLQQFGADRSQFYRPSHCIVSANHCLSLLGSCVFYPGKATDAQIVVYDLKGRTP